MGRKEALVTDGHPNTTQQPNVPGALVQPVPALLDLFTADDGRIVLYINSANGAFWFPIDPKAAAEFFERAARTARALASPLILPDLQGPGTKLG